MKLPNIRNGDGTCIFGATCEIDSVIWSWNSRRVVDWCNLNVDPARGSPSRGRSPWRYVYFSPELIDVVKFLEEVSAEMALMKQKHIPKHQIMRNSHSFHRL